MLIVSPPLTFVSSPGSILSSALKGMSLAISTSLTVPFLVFNSMRVLSMFTAKADFPVYSSAIINAPDNNTPDVAAATKIFPNFIFINQSPFCLF